MIVFTMKTAAKLPGGDSLCFGFLFVYYFKSDNI